MALNVAEKGFPISVFNRSYDKTEAAVKRAEKEGECGGVWRCGLLLTVRRGRRRCRRVN